MAGKSRSRVKKPSPPPTVVPPGEAPVAPPPPPSKAKWEGLSDDRKLEMALRHFHIKRADILSYRVYPHKVAIVYGFGQKVEYWPEEG